MQTVNFCTLDKCFDLGESETGRRCQQTDWKVSGTFQEIYIYWLLFNCVVFKHFGFFEVFKPKLTYLLILLCADYESLIKTLQIFTVLSDLAGNLNNPIGKMT